FLFFAGEVDLALQRIETALVTAEALLVPEALSQALNTKAVILFSQGRRHEGHGLARYALEVALEHDKPSAALRAYFNLADILGHLDRYEEAEAIVNDGIEFARRVGNRYWEWLLLGQGYSRYALGKWDELLARLEELPEDKWTEARQAVGMLVSIGVAANARRGNVEAARRIIEAAADWDASADVQERGSYHSGRASLFQAEGKPDHALEAARQSLAARETMGATQEYVKETFVVAVEAWLELGDLTGAEHELAYVEALPRGGSSQFLQAQTLRFKARIAAAHGEQARVE